MKRVHLPGVALLLAVTTSAWADGGPYSPDIGYDQASSKTRAQVVAELQEAQRLGLMASADGDFLNVGVADRSNATIVDQRVVRAKVRAETQEAARLGVLSNGEGGSTFATPQQQEMIAAAGRRAADDTLSESVSAHASVGPTGK
jgi:chromosome condensin MukBEF MukE localization factor